MPNRHSQEETGDDSVELRRPAPGRDSSNEEDMPPHLRKGHGRQGQGAHRSASVEAPKPEEPVPTGGAVAADLPAPISINSWRRALLISFLFTCLLLGMIAAFGKGFANLLSAQMASRIAGGAAMSGAALATSSPFPTLGPHPVDADPARHDAPKATAGNGSGSGGPSTPAAAGVTAFTLSPQVPTGWRIVRRYKHDKTSFTQGLAWCEALPQEQQQQNILYESRGMWARSGVRKMTLSPPATAAAGGGSGGSASTAERGDYAILKDVPIEGNGEFFGEGLTLWPGSALAAPANGSAAGSASSGAEAGVLVQLTWMNRRAFLYDPEDLRALGSFEYATTVTRERNNEGWGIAHDGTHLIVSDGTNNVIFWRLRWDPANPRASGYEEVRRIAVRDASRNVGIPSTVAPPKGVGQDIPLLNELEYAHGWLLSNIWFDNRIAVIDPGSGAAVAYLDLTPLREEQRNGDADVLNGLAYTMTLGPTSPAVDGVGAAPWGGRLWVTGKQWETLYELELTGLQTPNLALLRRERQLSRKARAGKAAGGASRQSDKGGGQ